MAFDNSSTIKEWLTTEEAAQYLSLSEASLKNMTSNGKISFYKLEEETDIDYLNFASLCSLEREEANMGIKQIPETGEWEAFYGKRHPITRVPFTRRRRRIRKKSFTKSIPC